MSHLIKRALTITGVILGVAGGTTFAQARVPDTVLDPIALERWADDVFGKALAEHRFSGLGIVITKGDRVLLQKGYGYQDWQSKTPVSPDATQFRIGSITKTFTATAILQLLERGQIKSLDDPANNYLKRIHFKPNDGQQITVWDLLTHSAGFGNLKPLSVDGYDAKLPFSEKLLESLQPDYVRARGSVSVYCNYCYLVLGVMIEDITGQAVGEYLDDHIFLPLGMQRTLLDPGQKPAPDTIVQYTFLPDGPALALPYPACPYEGIAPLSSADGCINSTLSDMSKWLIANIREGGGAADRVLPPMYWKLAHTRHRGNLPNTNGFGAAWWVYNYNGEKVVQHSGSIEHLSLALMFMDSKVGVFVTLAGGGEPSPNANVSSVVPAAVTGSVERRVTPPRTLILEHFLGAPYFATDSKADVTKYVGRYREMPKMQDPNWASIKPPNEITVASSGDGGLIIGGQGVYRLSGKDTFTLERAPDFETDRSRYVFETDAAGRVIRAYQDVNAGGFERLN